MSGLPVRFFRCELTHATYSSTWCCIVGARAWSVVAAQCVAPGVSPTPYLTMRSLTDRLSCPLRPTLKTPEIFSLTA